MFKVRKATAVIAAAGLSVVGMQAMSATRAGAAPARHAVSGHPGYRTAPTARIAKRSVATAFQHGVAPSTSVRPQVVPVGSFAPACYGDSRSIAPVGGTFDPISFGSFYNCSKQEWTFEIQTKDSWARNSLGDLTIFIDTSGSFTDGCGGFEYQAFIAQVAKGSFAADVVSSGGDPTGQNCSFGPTMPASMSISANSVAVSFPAADLLDPNTGLQGTAVAWTGLLQSLTEATNQTTFQGQFVPAATFIDGPVEGSVYDSIPAAYPAAFCGNSPPSAPGAYNATTNNGPAATAALQHAGFANVRNDSEGIVSFSGDGAAASRVLSAAGVAAKVALARPMRPASYYLAPAANPVNDPGYSSQWNLPVVGAPGAWAVTHGNNIVVADVDSGVDFTHPDLGANLVAGEDMSTNTAMTSGNTDTETSAGGHGTAVAGVIAAVTDNSADLASLGWNTKVEPVKVNFDDQTNVDAQIAAGIDWAANNTTNPVSVINLSLGGPCYDPTIATAIDSALAKGILVVAAAGNEAIHPGFDPNEGFSDAESYPAADPCQAGDVSCIISVAATGQNGYRAAYSDTGSYVSMVAPGGSGNACPSAPPCPNDNLPLLQAGSSPNPTTSGAGTSFAAPQVAATAALILAVNPTLTASQVRELIVGTATNLGPDGTNIEYGAGMLNASAALADTPPTTSGFGTFYSQTPSRILDTRIGLGAPKAKLGQGATLALTIPSASTDSAVVLNVTATGGTKSSFLTIWPAGQPRPTASNLNFLPGKTVPNLVTVQVGTGGVVDIYNAVGATDVLADLEGAYGNGTSVAAGSTFVPTAPTRVLDTRTTGGPIGAGEARNLVVRGDGTVPSTATAIVANVTATAGTNSSFLTIWPADQPRPNTSNVNFVTNQTVANLVTVQLAADHSIDIYNPFGTVQVIVDVEGYFTAAADTSGSRFFPVVNHRILDTRGNIGGFLGPIGQGQSDSVQVIGAGGVIDGASGVVMNLTATQGTRSSFLEVYPAGTTRPVASNINFKQNQTLANLVSVPIGTPSGQDAVYNSFGTAHAIEDVVGWYGPAGH